MRDPTLGERLLETRIELLRDTGWYGVSYLWNDEQTDATLALGGSQLDVEWITADGQVQQLNYQIPNANQCLTCHNQDKQYVPLGPTAMNMNRDLPGEIAHVNQLEHLAEREMLRETPSLESIERMPSLEDPHSGSLAGRARAWLDVNCAHCHSPRGTARTTGLDLRWSQQDLGQLGQWKRPVAAGHGSGGRLYDIVPGKPDESILIYRMESEGASAMMPNLGRQLVHRQALDVVRQWIEELPTDKELPAE
jgi:uncharacterized repeat protein (TIGR03806 family)